MPNYDEVPYRSVTFAASAPDRLAAVAALHGLESPDPRTSRYLELGCGDGTNALAVAAAFPEASCIGIDSSEGAIARGTELRDAAGLGRVVLEATDLLDPELAERVGPADYVCLHGVLSWVEADVRQAALALIGRVLTPGGVALISYNALPGWHQRSIARDIALAGVESWPDDPVDRSQAARDAIAAARELHGAGDAYDAALELAEQRFAAVDPAVLAHDDLSAVCVPFGVATVAAMAEEHGLTYMGEALPARWWRWRLPPKTAARLRETASGDDEVALQAQADLASGTPFNASLFVPSGQATGAPQAERVLGLRARRALSPQEPREGEAPALAALEDALAAGDPDSIPVRELCESAGLGEEAGSGALLRLVAEGRATLHSTPPDLAASAGERPVASRLARAQSARGAVVSSLRHESITFSQDFGGALLNLLDGTRDRERLGGELQSRADELGIDAASIQKGLDGSLAELARLGLLPAA